MDGFNVTPESLRAVQDLLGLAAADVASICGSWDSGTRNLGAAFTIAECARAFLEFQQYVFENLGSCQDALQGLARAAGDSAVAYESADGTGTGRFGVLESGLR